VSATPSVGIAGTWVDPCATGLAPGRAMGAALLSDQLLQPVDEFECLEPGQFVRADLARNGLGRPFARQACPVGLQPTDLSCGAGRGLGTAAAIR
jgi:hypothetical protein